MKFVCDQCKAKYQIADDKVAGKTVRMKCRKCAHMIEVRAAVTETSVATKPPPSSPPPAGPDGGGEHLVLTAPAVMAPQTQKPPATMAVSLATSLAGAPRPAPRASPPRQPDAGGALAGAFQRTVQRDDEVSTAFDLLELSASDEWYVAINGVPVGPIRIAELRRKATLGAVTEDSLVWQEGFEEWRPVRTVAELASLVREASTAGPQSSIPPPPVDARPSALPTGGSGARSPSVRPAAPGRLQGPSAAPRAAPAMMGRGNVIPFSSRTATAERFDEALVTAAAIPPPAPEPTPDPTSIAAIDPFARSPQANLAPPSSAFGAAPAASPSIPMYAPEGPVRRPPMGFLIAISLLTGALAMGVLVLVLRPQPQAPAAPQERVVLVPTPMTAAPAPSSPSAEPAPSAPSRPAPGSVAASKPAAPASPADAKPNAAIADLLRGSSAGPSAGPAAGGSGGGATSLTSDQIEAVVRQRQAGVKRACWDKLEAHAQNVRVTLSLRVNGAGQVDSATATGTDVAVAHCIENSAKSWRFPATGGTSTFNVPFTFLNQ